MSDAVLVAVLGLVGTLVGSLLGILVTQKLVTYRLDRLEKKQDIHNGIIERVYIAEGHIAELQHDIKDLKAYHRPQ